MSGRAGLNEEAKLEGKSGAPSCTGRHSAARECDKRAKFNDAESNDLIFLDEITDIGIENRIALPLS